LPLTFETIFLAKRVKHKKAPYIYKEYEKVLNFEKESYTVKISIKYPKKVIFWQNTFTFSGYFAFL
jgi:hypothetical protein